MTEYLIRLLKEHYKVATLSRGYKRSTSGFVLAGSKASAETIGDEPFQFYSKFNDIIVSVDSDRRHGIQQLQNLEDSPEVILLDDAFQHRRVKAGFNILLTAYDDLYTNDILLPTGNLREPRSGAKRANLIVVTKCPEGLNDADKSAIVRQLKPTRDQQVFFSTINYADMLVSEKGKIPLNDLSGKPFTLVTGIANPKPLLEHLKAKGLHFKHLNFGDHHKFTDAELNILKDKPLIITTEKDHTRLKDHLPGDILYYLPISVSVSEGSRFNELITEFVSRY